MHAIRLDREMLVMVVVGAELLLPLNSVIFHESMLTEKQCRLVTEWTIVHFVSMIVETLF